MPCSGPPVASMHLGGPRGVGQQAVAASPAVHRATGQEHHLCRLELLPNVRRICVPDKREPSGDEALGKCRASIKRDWHICVMRCRVVPGQSAVNVAGPPLQAFQVPPCTCSRRSQRNMPADGTDHSARPARCCRHIVERNGAGGSGVRLASTPSSRRQPDRQQVRADCKSHAAGAGMLASLLPLFRTRRCPPAGKPPG